MKLAVDHIAIVIRVLIRVWVGLVGSRRLSLGLGVSSRANLLEDLHKRFNRAVDRSRVVLITHGADFGNLSFNAGFQIGGDFVSEVGEGFFRAVDRVVGGVAGFNQIAVFAVFLGMCFSILAHLFDLSIT